MRERAIAKEQAYILPRHENRCIEQIYVSSAQKVELYSPQILYVSRSADGLDNLFNMTHGDILQLMKNQKDS